VVEEEDVGHGDQATRGAASTWVGLSTVCVDSLTHPIL
jgi:hypothetical protein